MIRSSFEKDFPTKKEGDTNDGKNPQEPSSSRPWPGFKDPRIVRVSRTFGGKDRHSKVRTVKGLRDRRVRLSVPTAIQLYDLQERLGLNQPSKAVDWLLNATQHAIDELPPLQLPPENYLQYSQPMVVPHDVTASQAPSSSLLYANTEEHLRRSGAHSLTLLSGNGNVKDRNDMVAGTDQTALPKSMYWSSNDPSTIRAKCKDADQRETIVEKSDWMKRNDQHYNQAPIEVLSAQKWTHNSLQRPSHHSFLTGSQYYHLELPPNASVSQTEELHNYNTISLPSSLALPSGPQLLLYPSGTTPSIIPSYSSTPSADFDPKQITNFQMLSSSSQNLLPNSIAAASLYSINPAARAFQLNNIAPKHHHSHSHGSQPNDLEKGTNSLSSATATGSFLNDSKATLGSNPSSFL